MTTSTTVSQGLTSYSRFVLNVLVLPSLFIAGVQLFILSDQTETYFAWTFASALSAAFMGAGYWSAIPHAYTGARAKGWEYVRSSMPAALTATTLLTIATFIHLDQFHFDSPLFITRFVTWVWMAIYIFVPPILAIAWIIQSRLPSAHVKGQHPLPSWIRVGFLVLSAFALLSSAGLFLAPQAMAAFWPWTVSPLAARAISSWLGAFGVACATLVFENDIKFGAGTCSIQPVGLLHIGANCRCTLCFCHRLGETTGNWLYSFSVARRAGFRCKPAGKSEIGELNYM